MARRTKDTKHESFEGDVIVTPAGHKILSLGWYVRMGKAAMEERDWCSAWHHFGSAQARTTDPAEIWDLKQLEKKAYKLMLNRKSDRKKDKDKRRKRREYA